MKKTEIDVPGALLFELPTTVVQRLAAFLNQGMTGNFILNVRDGRVLGLKIEETLRLDKPNSPE